MIFFERQKTTPTLVETWKTTISYKDIFLAQVSCMVIPGVSQAMHCKYLHMFRHMRIWTCIGQGSSATFHVIIIHSRMITLFSWIFFGGGVRINCFFKCMWQELRKIFWCNKGMCKTLALPFTLKIILMQKKNYGNSNISPYKTIIFKKSFKRNQNPSRYFNSIITNLKFQHKPKYHLSKILV
jgi:hypothetical protein